MMGNCRDCAHWGNGKPRRAANYSPKKRCAIVLTNFSEAPAMISVVGDIEYGDDPADFLTAPDFGFVLWEAKEEA
jgi:hypothetical protein